MQFRNVENIDDLTQPARTPVLGMKNRFKKGVEVHVQSFRGLPLRVRTQDEFDAYELLMPARFQKAAEDIMSCVAPEDKFGNCWFFYGYRHGTLIEVAKLVLEELEDTINEQALQQWQKNMKANTHFQSESAFSSISLLRNYLRHVPSIFSGGASQTQRSLYSLSDPSPSDHASSLPSSISFASVIQAMNTPSDDSRRVAINFFQKQCQTRIDCYNPSTNFSK